MHEETVQYILNHQEPTQDNLKRIVLKRLYPYFRMYRPTKREVIWFRFINHTWKRYELGIAKAIPDCVGQAINDAISQSNIPNRLYELRTLMYEKRDELIRTLSEDFKDQTFINRLDRNEHLIPFQNGVFDEFNKEFRDGQPEDMLFLQMSMNYDSYDPNVSECIESFKQYREETNIHQLVRL